MGLERLRTGGRSFSGAGLEYDPSTLPDPTGTPGVPVTPTEFLPIKANNLRPNQQRITERVMSATRFSERIDEPTIVVCEGTETFNLNASLGFLRFLAGIGPKTTTTAVTTVSTGPVVTANGVSTIPVTGAFIPGAMVTIGTGATQEKTSVQHYVTGSLQVPALKNNAAAATGLAVVQKAQDKYANSLLPAARLQEMPLLTYELGTPDWSWVYSNIYVEEVDFTLNATICEVACKLYGTKFPVFRTATTTPAEGTYNPPAADEELALHSFRAQDAVMALVGDPDGTGTTRLGAVLGILDAKVTYNNGLSKFPVLGNDTEQAIPGDAASCMISYTELDTSHRPAIFDEYVRTAIGAQFSFGYVRNFGTATTPDLKGVNIFVPNGVYRESPPDTRVGEVNRYANTAAAKIDRSKAMDLVQLFVDV